VIKSARKCLVAALFLSASLSTEAVNAAYPDKPVTVIVPWAAGGSTDILARLVAQYLTESLGQSFVVENRSGASGNIGSAYVARATPDGYTLLVGTMSTHVINQSLFTNMPFDGARDFTPIGEMAVVTTTMVVSSDVPADNVAQLIAYARANPHKLAYATAGKGSNSMMGAAMFLKDANIDMVEIPYRGGAPAVLDTVAGRTQLFFTAATQTLPYVKSGKLKMLAVTDSKRSSFLPKVPSISETLPGYEMNVWTGMFGPKGMDPALANRLNAEMNKVLVRPDVIEKMHAMGVELRPGTQAAFSQEVAHDAAMYGDIIKSMNIQKTDE
jgi:tripartite-type tricarboxylate transporter receptor subunit TctC